MGNSFSWMWTMLGFGVKKKRVLMVGLDGSGKTTILYRLKLGKVVQTSPTNCFNVESFEHGEEVIEMWDIGGRWTIRNQFYPNTDGLIFVVDLHDFHKRSDEVYNSIISTIQQDEIHKRRVPLLIFLNKVDRPMSSEIEEEFCVDKLMNGNPESQGFVGSQIRTQRCSGVTGEGLPQGIDWLCNSMNNSVSVGKNNGNIDKTSYCEV